MGGRARIIRGDPPEKFERYLREQGKEYAFVTAWNEWGEGAYLEPDEWHGYAWLEAVRQAVAEANAD